MSNYEIPKATPTVQEFGFVEHTRGPDFMPPNAELLSIFQDKVTGPLPTELLTTDQGNQIMLTSLVGLHKGLQGIAENIEEKGQNQYSDQIQGYVLQMLKTIADEAGRGIKRVVSPTESIYYAGNVGVNNGRLVRVFLSKIGSNEAGIPVYAKIAACRTKKQEQKVYTLLGFDGKGKV
jgi:hypothetical protein